MGSEMCIRDRSKDGAREGRDAAAKFDGGERAVRLERVRGVQVAVLEDVL